MKFDELNDRHFVMKCDLDASEPYFTVCDTDDPDSIEKVLVPKQLAYLLRVHFCGSKTMRENIVESTRREIANQIKAALGLDGENK